MSNNNSTLLPCKYNLAPFTNSSAPSRSSSCSPAKRWIMQTTYDIWRRRTRTKRRRFLSSRKNFARSIIERKSLRDSAISCMRPSTSVFWRLAKWRLSSTDRRTPIKKKFNKGLGGLFPWLTFCRAQRLVNGLVAGRERRDYRAVIRASRARKVFNSPRQEYNHEQGGFGTRCALYIYLHPTAANSTSI